MLDVKGAAELMAAQVEVQTGEVGRTVVGGRLHLSPLSDSSNSLVELPSISQNRIITPEPNKPVPGPKPRFTPKPFAVEKNPTIKPIVAPKPLTKARPESTRLPGHKPDPPCTPKPQQPAPKLNTVSTPSNRPAFTSFKSASRFSAGQTTKPVAQPFKPAPPLEPIDPDKPVERPRPASLTYSHSLKKLPAAEWSGTTNQAEDRSSAGKGGVSITRAKSMGFLAEVGKDEEDKERAKQEVAVVLRPRASRPRPVSAIFLDSTANADTPTPAPRWTGRRPLSADLTSKFESIGLSLHRKTPKGSTEENTPEEKAAPERRAPEKPVQTITPQGPEGVAVVSEQSVKKTEEVTVRESDEERRAASIKSRISLLLDSSPSSPGAPGPGPDLLSPQPEGEAAVCVKQLIKQLTEDTTPTQSPTLKPALKSRPLPLDRTKR